ncbi:hypothetical protein A3B46_00135 [Candidatus Roizmanbacteria bacterium RIFCSPLOWO2_01_FULL_39_19]|nr:MAG: hypothetical protein A3B46_00135 [Candidatus Roizmanbacteria bacterium RIFCSPLOWO2_01_FULL_39_19]
MVLFHKWTLLGIKTSIAPFFQGPIYLYMLYPFFVLFNLQPIAGAVAAVVISTITLVLLYVTVNKYFSQKAALLSSLLFATSPGFIMYGRTPLYQHILPLFIVFSMYFFLSYKKKILLVLFLGITVGIGIELHRLNISLAFALLIYLVLFQKFNWRVIVGYLSGIIIGISPTLFFELRHQFLNTRLSLNYIGSQHQMLSLAKIFGEWIEGVTFFIGGNIEVIGIAILLCSVGIALNVKGLTSYSKTKKLLLILVPILVVFSFKVSALGSHYMLPLWVLLVMVLPAFSLKVLSDKIVTWIFTLLVVINIFTAVHELDNNHGYTMPSGWTLRKIQSVGKIIATDAKKHPNFNVASLLDGNTRTYPTRYTTLLYGGQPADVDQYPYNNYLYVTYDKNKSELFKVSTWEVTSLSPFKIGKEWDLKDGVILYRLDRIRKK